MLRRFFTCSIGILTLGGSFSALAQSERRIPLSQLEAMFADMRKRTKWNLDGPLLWGYFFVDTGRERLNKLAARLQNDGYRLVEIRLLEDSAILHQLHVEKIELHSPDSLHARNTQLYALASEFGVSSYDGMDVGPAGHAAK